MGSKSARDNPNQMSDSTQDFFDAIVDPAIEEFRAAEDELCAASLAKDEDRLERARSVAMRRARQAAIELHQFADRVSSDRPPWAAALNPEGLRNWLMTDHCDRRPDDVLVLHDVADAFKHAALTNPRKGRAWLVRTDRAVIMTSTGWGELGWGEARWDGPEQVIIKQEDGSKRSLIFVLDTVRNAWRRAMGRPLES